jgi:hypothetical protein
MNPIVELYRNNFPLLHFVYSARPETFSQKRKPNCSPGSYQLHDMARGLRRLAMVRFQRYGIVPGRCPELSPFLKDNFRLFSFEKTFFWICIVD